MKTTLNINDELVASAKALAALQQSTLTRLIEEGLRLRLAAGKALGRPVRSGKPKLPVFHGKGGLHSGIKATSNRAMLEAAES